jgi:hypothetical protein
MKKNLLVLICLFFYLTSQVNAQKKVIDDNTRALITNSLNKLKTTKLNDEKIELYLNLFKYSNNPDSAYYYGNLAYILAANSSNPNLINRTYDDFASINNYLGNYNLAINILLEVIAKLKGINDTLTMDLYNEIQRTYRRTKDFKNQLHYSFLVHDLEEKYGSGNLSGSLASIGDAYQSLNMLDSALFYFNKDYERILKDSKMKNYKGGYLESKYLIPIGNLGEINLRLGENDIALNYFRKLNKANEKGKNFLEPEMYREMSKCFKNMKQKDSAIFYANESFKWGNYYLSNSEIKETANYLTTLYGDYNMKDSAFKYQNIYVKIQDSLFSNEKIRNLQIATIQENIKQEKIKEELKKEQEERQNNLILAAIGFFIPVFITVVFLISKWSKKRSKLIASLGIASLLMLFEFISLLIHPYVEKYTEHNIILMYIVLLIIASALVPLHHKMEEFVKKNFIN